MSTRKNSTHDSLVKTVEQELKSRGYKNIHPFEKYKTRFGDGEVDIYTITGDYILNFEIKSTYTQKGRKKAIQQLYRSEKTYFSKKYKVFNFFVYWSGHTPVYEQIRH